MTTLTDYTPGQYTRPASCTVAPPLGGWWWMRVDRAQARDLITRLLRLPVPPEVAVEVWPNNGSALVIVDKPSAGATGVRLVMSDYGTPQYAAAGSITLDVTGTYARGARALEVL